MQHTTQKHPPLIQQQTTSSIVEEKVKKRKRKNDSQQHSSLPIPSSPTHSNELTPYNAKNIKYDIQNSNAKKKNFRLIYF